MSVYYVFACHERREQIDPDLIADEKYPRGGGIQAEEVLHGVSLRVAAAYVLAGEWSGMSIVADSNDEMDAVELYRDVTEDAVNHYNERWCRPAGRAPVSFLNPDERLKQLSAPRRAEPGD